MSILANNLLLNHSSNIIQKHSTYISTKTDLVRKIFRIFPSQSCYPITLIKHSSLQHLRVIDYRRIIQKQNIRPREINIRPNPRRVDIAQINQHNLAIRLQ